MDDRARRQRGIERDPYTDFEFPSRRLYIFAVPLKLKDGENARREAAISLCVGAEALIVLRDSRGLDQRAAADVSAWTAKALPRASLDEAKSPAPSRARRR